VPFLDKEFLDYSMAEIDPADKLCGRAANGKIEKWIIREAFKGYLPDAILWRQKEQFSDGVSGKRAFKNRATRAWRPFCGCWCIL
jgi:asparagine synthase (glutamine-hydrolysing)